MACLRRPTFVYGWVTVLTAVALLGASSPTTSQQTISPAERRAQINRVLDGLNSPDPTTRLVTLESAAAGSDANLRRIALSTAFASSDSVLRAAALTATLGTSATFVVDMAPVQGGQGVLQGTGGSFEVRVLRFNRATGSFESATRFAKRNETLVPFPAAVSGDRISFDAGFWFPNDLTRECSGVARLESGGTTLKGTMGCTGTGEERYAIKIDILR
ncbi:MAG: hypothetical protein QOI11_3983 [Candidatus Eremiobacteraeota bacterium]|jgi:hypothetical protein|nr:hypothetical protein [Candidatus Eremiobacteraeota bacterium]